MNNSIERKSTFFIKICNSKRSEVEEIAKEIGRAFPNIEVVCVLKGLGIIQVNALFSNEIEIKRRVPSVVAIMKENELQKWV